MAYEYFQPTKPTTAGSPTPTRQESIDATRQNLVALRDTLAALGVVPGFDYSVNGGTAEEPAELHFKKGVEWIKVVLTWGTTGGEDGNVTKAAYYYSSNSGSSYDAMTDDGGEFVMTLTYDANGNCTGTSWGSTP